ncbi:MAG TPA: acyl-CoA thioesterase [Gammaproteobacteria bacterium]|nr:acyl-CoA thioesterase [Gammaproteobacteria bacterium]
MFTQTMTPAFCETDALGHISNTVIPRWFESARDPVFRLFSPDLDHHKWQLILAKYEIEFKAELFYGLPVDIKTWISHLGNSSMHVTQQVWQKDRLTVEGTTVMVHFDYTEKKPSAIPDEIKKLLKPHCL